MTWLALLLIGVAASDLAFSVTRRNRGASLTGAVVAVGAGLAVGITGRDLVGLALIGLAALVWGESVTRGFGRHRPVLPLFVLGVAVVAVALAAPIAPETGGLWAEWIEESPLVGGVDPDRALLVLGVLAVQLSTGNVLVRLVLAANGTTNPLHARRDGGPAPALKGGRLLGPMERLLILGLGLAGDLTAAGIVIAAKGLLRFPELSAARSADPATPSVEPGIHEVTEYFLVGSFASWLIPLACLAVLG